VLSDLLPLTLFAARFCGRRGIIGADGDLGLFSYAQKKDSFFLQPPRTLMPNPPGRLIRCHFGGTFFPLSSCSRFQESTPFPIPNPPFSRATPPSFFPRRLWLPFFFCR